MQFHKKKKKADLDVKSSQGAFKDIFLHVSL